MTYLFLDPGRATGWAKFDNEGLPIGRGIARGLDTLMTLLDGIGPIDTVVYEDFRLFQHKAIQQSGSHMEASQAIGIILALSRKWNAKVYHQQPQCHKLGQMYPGGQKPRGAHDDNHDVVAYNHGIYYLTKNKIIGSSFDVRQQPRTD